MVRPFQVPRSDQSIVISAAATTVHAPNCRKLLSQATNQVPRGFSLGSHSAPRIRALAQRHALVPLSLPSSLDPLPFLPFPLPSSLFPL
jgi:hypothetical protein